MFVSVTASAAVRTSVHVHTTRGVQLTPDTLLGYERSGFAVTRALLPPSRVHELRPTLVKALEERRHAALKQKVRVLIGEEEADADAETLDARLRRLPEGSVPFLQCFNVHRHYAPVAELARSLAPTAAQLLGSARVRLYQDSLFLKRPGDGPTRWHADLAMAPLDTNDFVTCWLPLQPVPCEEDGGSALVFAAGSHLFTPAISGQHNVLRWPTLWPVARAGPSVLKPRSPASSISFQALRSWVSSALPVLENPAGLRKVEPAVRSLVGCEASRLAS